MSLMTPDNQRNLIRDLTMAFGPPNISVDHRQSLLDYHDRVLELQGQEKWRLLPTLDYREMVAAT